MRIFGVMIAALLTLSGCSTRESSQGGTADTTGVKVSLALPVTFINRVWVVAESDQGVSRGASCVSIGRHTRVDFPTWHSRVWNLELSRWTPSDHRGGVEVQRRHPRIDPKHISYPNPQPWRTGRSPFRASPVARMPVASLTPGPPVWLLLCLGLVSATLRGPLVRGRLNPIST